MPVRITSHHEGSRLVVSVHGRLDEPASGLLRAEAGQVPAEALVLDLSCLVAFDEAGLVTLRSLVCRGAHIEGASPYVKLRLDPGASSAGRRAPL